MLRVGLTGGIGSGKSTVAGRLAEHGAVLIDSDQLAREVVEPGTDGLAEIVDEFGPEVLTAAGTLDRAALAARVFPDPEARARLNAIVHPRVGARTAERMAEAAPDAVVVHDVPLLVENGLGPNYHLVIVVDAPVETRVRRLVRTRGMSEVDVQARIAAQAGESDRRAVADVWLDNAGAPDEILAAVDTLWADRLVRYESNLRLHRRPGYGSPRLREPDPTWPAQADRLAARIRRVAGERVLRVDHIGSTAIPGMPAKDIIDLQLAVSTWDDADAVAEPLAAAGFPPWPEITAGAAHGGDSEEWRKRVHSSADPGRLANLHIRVHGSLGWRYALQVRDWLRAEPGARAEYGALKQELAATFAADEDYTRYGEAKAPWFDRITPRMAEWAERTGWQPPEETSTGDNAAGSGPAGSG